MKKKKKARRRWIDLISMQVFDYLGTIQIFFIYYNYYRVYYVIANFFAFFHIQKQKHDL